MRRTFGAALVVGVALVLAAVVPSPALAQEEPVEVVDSETGMPCNPCLVHLVGETVIRTSSGIGVLGCQDEFSVNIYHDGTGELEWQGQEDPLGGPRCNTVNCAPPANHWLMERLGELATSQTHFDYTFCFFNNICTGEVSVTELGVGSYEFDMHHRCPFAIFPYIEVESHWETEHDPFGQYDDIEIVHSDA